MLDPMILLALAGVGMLAGFVDAVALEESRMFFSNVCFYRAEAR